MSGDAQHACPADHEQEPGQGHQRVRADLAQMSQRRAQIFPELQPLIGRLRDQSLQRPEVSRS